MHEDRPEPSTEVLLAIGAELLAASRALLEDLEGLRPDPGRGADAGAATSDDGGSEGPP